MYGLLGGDGGMGWWEGIKNQRVIKWWKGRNRDELLGGVKGPNRAPYHHFSFSGLTAPRRKPNFVSLSLRVA